MSDGCVWPLVYCDCAPMEGLTTAERRMYERMAVDYLYAWTRGAFGLCPAVVRPCGQEGCSAADGFSTFYGRGPFGNHWGPSGSPWRPVLLNGRWYNISCGSCDGPCSCKAPCSLSLPGPVHSVEKVWIDGAQFTDWRVDEAGHLIRTDGPCWPTCQDMGADPTTKPNTFMVSYTRGREVPDGGQVAAGILACEFAKAALRRSDCALPARIQSITRQGVSVTLVDNFEGLDKGRTGIWLIDSWVASVTAPLRRATVISPDYR